MYEQDSQCTLNVTLSRVRATIVAVEKELVLYYEWVFVALVVQQARRMRHIVNCGTPRSTIFFHIILQTARISKTVIETKICAWMYSTTFVWNISPSKKK